MVDAALLRHLQTQVETAPPAEALAASKQLIELLTPLAQEAPAKYSTQLATAWQDCGFHASTVEGPEVAVAPLTTAVRLFTDIANDTDALSLLRLAQAQQSLAEEQIRLEQYQPAYLILQEARSTGASFARLEPETGQLIEARTFRLLATTYHHRGDYANAVAHGEEAEQRYRRVVRKEPAMLPDLAATLKQLALSLSHEDADDLQIRQAQRKIDEALVCYGSLAKRAPRLFQADYANTTFHFATILMARGKRLQSVGAYERAADLYAQAVEHDPMLAESYRIAASMAVDTNEAVGNDRRARKLRARYGL